MVAPDDDVLHLTRMNIYNPANSMTNLRGAHTSMEADLGFSAVLRKLIHAYDLERDGLNSIWKGVDSSKYGQHRPDQAG